MTEKKWSTGGWKNTTAKGEVINFTINDVKYSMSSPILILATSMSTCQIPAWSQSSQI